MYKIYITNLFHHLLLWICIHAFIIKLRFCTRFNDLNKWTIRYLGMSHCLCWYKLTSIIRFVSRCAVSWNFLYKIGKPGSGEIFTVFVSRCAVSWNLSHKIGKPGSGEIFTVFVSRCAVSWNFLHNIGKTGIGEIFTVFVSQCAVSWNFLHMIGKPGSGEIFTVFFTFAGLVQMYVVTQTLLHIYIYIL